MLEPSSLQISPTFKDMFDIVHIDEKWFYLPRTAERYSLHPLEVNPYRTCKSKRFSMKVMFLAGSLETKPIIPVTKDVIHASLINKVLPAIREKWPRDSPVTTIYIQQDNAKPRVDPMDREFVEAAQSEGFDIRLKFQPPNNPYLNVLDLEYFRAIQSLQYRESLKTIDELVSAVDKSFSDMISATLNKIFLSLQACMTDVIKTYGGNCYKEPHIGKDRMIRDGTLPSQLQFDLEIVEAAFQHLQS